MEVNSRVVVPVWFIQTWFDFFEPDYMSMLELKQAVKECGVKSTNYMLLKKLYGFDLRDINGLRLVKTDTHVCEIDMFMSVNNIVEMHVDMIVDGHSKMGRAVEKGRAGEMGRASEIIGSSEIGGTSQVKGTFEVGGISRQEGVGDGNESEQESLHDSKYDSSDNDMLYEVNLDDDGKNKGGRPKSKAKEKGKLVEWCYGASKKPTSVQPEYDSDDSLKGYISHNDVDPSKRGRVWNPRVDMEKLVFEVKLEFRNHVVCQQAIKRHAILEGK